MTGIKNEIKKYESEKEKVIEKKLPIETEKSESEKILISKPVKSQKIKNDDVAKITPSSLQEKSFTTIKGFQKQRQVKILSDLALEKGINYAVSIAKRLDNAYVLDEFHDSLVDELYEELKRKGKLKEL